MMLVGRQDFAKMVMPAQNRLYWLRRLKRQVTCLIARRFDACSWLLPAEKPIRSKNYNCEESRVEQILIFLPGIGDLPEDYERNGFIDSVRRSGISIDMAVADLHFGYYLTRTAVERLHQDIVLPARGMGYKHVSLAGISLGGFGALYYSMYYPEEISRLFLMAPYLGGEQIIAEISEAGGLKQWDPGNIDERDYQRRLWQWLKQYGGGENELPKLYLGYGLQDHFATANKLLSELVPQNRIYTVEGRHNWRTWRRLWNNFVGDPKSFHD
jgi:pimeloyl-ACP methyl ester carboxylesterase